MHTIRREQMVALEPEREGRLVRDLIARGRTKYPELLDGIGPEEVLRRFTISVRTAARYNFRSYLDQCTFADFMMRVGPLFHCHPAVQNVLNDPWLPSTLRLDFLLTELSPDAWWDILESSSPLDWNSMEA